ncbi:MAG: CBS domain-containing protein [Nitrospirales bacterium]
MKVKDLMTKSASTCDEQTNLSSAALMMWDGDCGILPMVDERRKVVGVITDRDLSLAMASKNRFPADILVGEIVEKGDIVACSPDDDVKKALNIMGEHQIRRLPVVNEQGQIQGILSINDLILHSQAESGDLSDKNVMEAMKAICSQQAIA